MLLTWYAASWGTLQAFHLVIIISLVRAQGWNGSGIWDVLATKPILENVQKICMVTLPVDQRLQQHYAKYHMKQVTYLLFGHTLVLINFHKKTSQSLIQICIKTNVSQWWTQPYFFPDLSEAKECKNTRNTQDEKTNKQAKQNRHKKHGDYWAVYNFWSPLLWIFLPFLPQ